MVAPCGVEPANCGVCRVEVELLLGYERHVQRLAFKAGMQSTHAVPSVLSVVVLPSDGVDFRPAQPVTHATASATDDVGSVFRSTGYETMVTRRPGGPPPLEFGSVSTATNRSSVDPHGGHNVGVDPHSGHDAVGEAARDSVAGTCPAGRTLRATAGADTLACLWACLGPLGRPLKHLDLVLPSVKFKISLLR